MSVVSHLTEKSAVIVPGFTFCRFAFQLSDGTVHRVLHQVPDTQDIDTFRAGLVPDVEEMFAKSEFESILNG